MRISLVDRDIVDKIGVKHRLDEDLRQLEITDCMLEGFKDWGLITHEGFEYYMSSYTPPLIEVDEE